MDEKPNVILITIDCLRADHVSCLGYNRKTTPNLDKFAKKGILFTQAIANGSSTPMSFPSTLTSTYPLMYPDYPKISKFRTTLAEVLTKNGYKTAAFHSNPYLSRYYGYDKGFDVFEDSFEYDLSSKNDGSKIKDKIKQKIREIISKDNQVYKLAEKTYNFLTYLYPDINIPYETADAINQKAISWLEKNTSRFFTWLHYMDTHHPFVPPKQFYKSSVYEIKRAEYIICSKNIPIVSHADLQNIINLYDGTIMYVDQTLESLFQKLKKLDILDNTFIIVTADHGEEFKEHGEFSHKAKLYDELIHVPLILSAPGLPSNIKIDKPVSLLDLAPTILDYLGLSVRNNFRGKSLLPLIRGEETIWREEGIISETLSNGGKVALSIEDGYRIISYRTKNWKYILNKEKNKRELYNLEVDPHETKNLYMQEKKIAEKFEKKIVEHLRMEEKTQKLAKEITKVGKIRLYHEKNKA